MIFLVISFLCALRYGRFYAEFYNKGNILTRVSFSVIRLKQDILPAEPPSVTEVAKAELYQLKDQKNSD